MSCDCFTVCPFCGYEHELSSAVTRRGEHTVEPRMKPGDATLCIRCGEFSVMGFSEMLRKPKSRRKLDAGPRSSRAAGARGVAGEGRKGNQTMIFEGRVLALDLATTTGWAFGAPGSIPQFGHLRFSKPGSARPVTYRAFRTWLEDRWNVRDHQPDLVVYESPAVPSIMAGKTNIDTIKLLVGLAEHLEEWCHKKVELREARVADVRVHFIGQNMKSAYAKQKTLEQCVMLGWKVETADEADACALWDFQCAWLNPRLAAHSTPLFHGKRR